MIWSSQPKQGGPLLKMLVKNTAVLARFNWCEFHPAPVYRLVDSKPKIEDGFATSKWPSSCCPGHDETQKAKDCCYGQASCLQPAVHYKPVHMSKSIVSQYGVWFSLWFSYYAILRKVDTGRKWIKRHRDWAKDNKVNIQWKVSALCSMQLSVSFGCIVVLSMFSKLIQLVQFSHAGLSEEGEPHATVCTEIPSCCQANHKL